MQTHSNHSTKPMQTLFKSVLTLFVVLFLAGCAEPRPANVQSFHNAPSKDGYATVYIYRPEHDVGSGVWPEVLLNGKKTVALKNGSYSVLYLKPGQYQLTSDKSSAISGLTNHPAKFEIPENGVYFLKYETTSVVPKKGVSISEVKSGGFRGVTIYTRWALFSRQEAISEIAYCYYIIPYAQFVPE